MRIVGLKATPVTVPAEAPWRWSMGIETGTTRTIIELETDEGITGIGETYGGARTVEALKVAFWGGFRANQRMAAVCEAFGLGVGMHSDRELGISTAAMVHLACSLPNLAYAIDSHYHDQVDDIITTPWTYRDGAFALPDGPGLGVEIDRDKLAFYHRYFLEHQEVNEFYDPYRPGWVPALPIF